MDLLDYINPFSESADSITQVSVLIIFSVAFASIIYLIITYIGFRKFFNQDTGLIIKSEKLNNILFDFKSGLIEHDGNKKSFERFQDKVNKSVLLNLFFNDKVLNAVSNMLVGFGILGTFLGLSKGVSGFEMDSTDAIKESIGSLLSGMGTAFISSIWGMFSSLLFIFIYQLVRHEVAKKTDQFYALMDQEFFFSELDKESHQNELLKDSLRDVVKEYFVQEEDGQERTPKYYYRELLHNAQAQTSSLSTFVDDLGEVLEDMMDELLKTNSNYFKEIIDEKLMPILEQLRKEKEESASGALEGVLNSLQDAMKEMLNDFKDSISGETKGEMETLTRSLSHVTEALGNMPEDIKGLSSGLTENMNDLANTIQIVVKDIYKEQERSEEMRKETQDQANVQLKGILDGVGENVGSLLEQQSISAKKLAEVLDTVDDIVSKNNDGIKSFQQLLNNSKATFENIKASSDALTDATSALMEGANALESNNKAVKEAVQSFVSENNESIDKIRSLQDEVISKTKEFLNQFSKMEDGIDNVFGQFNDGLEKYTENLSAALSEELVLFTDSTASALESISGLTEQIPESIDNLAEMISKIK